jgi:glycosyltransferase involved in cell wall biosynthesis
MHSLQSPAEKKMDHDGGSGLRICLVSPVPPPRGGIGRWTTHVHRWAAGEPNIRISQVDISPRWRYVDDLAVWKRVIGGGIQLMRDYIKFLKAVRGAHVIHLTTSGCLATVRDLLICATARLLHRPLVYHLHFGRVSEIASSNTLEWRMLLRAMKSASVVLVLDYATGATVKKYLPHVRVEVVPNPVDLERLPAPSPSGSAKKTAFFLGWIIPSKGVEELLRTWSVSAAEGWELVLAGPVNPVYRDMLVARYQPNAVRFTGELPHEEAMRMMARCDFFILPSHTEAFPYVVLEAMALSKAILATHVGAIPDMLSGGCGFLIPPEDAAALAGGIEKLVCDEKLRFIMGERAREKATRLYALKTVMQEIAAIWRSLAQVQI